MHRDATPALLGFLYTSGILCRSQLGHPARVAVLTIEGEQSMGPTTAKYGPQAIPRKKVSATDILARKHGAKITSVTAYDYSTAKLVDAAGVDLILVGDSLGMVVLGYPDTTRVTLDDMVHHTSAVARAQPKALVVADLPFLTSGVSIRDTILNAGRLIREAGAEAVKLEGGVRVSDEIRALVDCQIPVMGHVGLTPQSIHAFGGFKVQGRTREAADQVLRDALAVQEGGAFSIVLEGIPAEPRRAHHTGAGHPHHRHRRRPEVRRSGAGLPRYAPPVLGFHAQVRQDFRGRRGPDPRSTGAVL